MQNITNTTQLQDAIGLLEYKQLHQRQLLHEQFSLVRESVKPLNLIKSSFHEAIASPDLISNIVSGAIGLAAGYISKKIFVGASGNVVRKLFGRILQFGVTKIIAKNPEGIKSLGQRVLPSLYSKKKISISQFENE